MHPSVLNTNRETMMSTLLLKNAGLLITMDPQRRQIENGGLFVRDNVIEAVGPSESLPPTADTVIDLRDHVVLPGLINTHHHLYQRSAAEAEYRRLASQ